MIGETFIGNLGVIIIAAAVFSLLAKRLQLPTIVAYLLAGLLLGPIAGIVQITDSLELISEVGIVLLLFLVGLELSFDKIRGMGRAVLWAGLGQLLITGIGGYAVAALLGFRPVEALFLAIALTFSSTVVAVKLLEEKHEFNQLHGRLAIGILLIQDLAVIVLLTLLSGLGSDDSLTLSAIVIGVAKALGGMALLLVGVMLASRYLLPRPLAWAAQSPPTLMCWSLCWCFFIVVAAHALHLSPETGAFLAGVSLAQLPFNQDLRRRVHPLMNFFVAVFFVSLGVQIRLNEAVPHWPEALVFIGFALIGKFAIIMWVLARLNVGEKTAHHAALTLGQISEFSFIFMAAGVQTGWIGSNVLSLVGLVGLVSFSVSSYLIVRGDWVYDLLRHAGVLRLFRAREKPPLADRRTPRSGHIIIVGLNTLGRLIATQLHERGERVLAVDTDLRKLADLPCETLHGNVEYLSLLEEAGLQDAKLLVSALRIETTNDLLAFHCRQAGVPCSIQVVDLYVTDNLLEMDVSYLMIPKVDGIKLQTTELIERGYLRP